MNELTREQLGIIRPESQNEMKEMIEEINSDVTDSDGFSKIDMRTRLSGFEIPAILSLDVCVAMGVFPKECSKLTRSKKRLAVSLQGKGRSEIVEMVKSENQNKELNSMVDKMRGNV